MSDPEPGSDVDVLVVGAGPTGLTLALELGAQGVDVAVVVRDPAWLTDVSISERCVDRLRHGRVLLAGDAAHIQSPAGARA